MHNVVYTTGSIGICCLYTELDRASCSLFRFEMGYIQLATRLGVSVNNTCTTPFAARCVASNAHANIRLPRISNVDHTLSFLCVQS